MIFLITCAFVYIIKINNNANNSLGRSKPHIYKKMKRIHVTVCLVSAVGRASVQVMCYTRTRSTPVVRLFFHQSSVLLRKQVWLFLFFLFFCFVFFFNYNFVVFLFVFCFVLFCFKLHVKWTPKMKDFWEIEKIQLSGKMGL
jgi:hypothetical protein